MSSTAPADRAARRRRAAAACGRARPHRARPAAPPPRPRDRQERRLPAAVRDRGRCGGVRAGLPRARCRASTVPLQARAGLHVGPVMLRANAAADIALGAKPVEVEGIAKPTAARIMALAQRRPDAADAPTRGGARRRGRWRLQLRHGHWRLKGVDEPVELFEPARADCAPRAAARHRRPTASCAAATCGCRCARCRAQPAGRARCLHRPRVDAAASSRGASTPARGWSTCSASAAPARRAWPPASAGAGSATSRRRLVLRPVAGAQPRRHRLRGRASARRAARPATTPWRSSAARSPARGRAWSILDNFEQVAAHAAATLGRWLDRAPRGALHRHQRASVLGIAGEVGAAAARRCRRTTAVDAVPAARARRAAAASSRDADDQRAIEPLVASCSTGCRSRSSWPRRACA